MTTTAQETQKSVQPIAASDLTQRPPRSPRSQLGGYALLPRMLDKGRAALAGTSGEYHYDCPMDQHILNFLGIKADALREQLAAGLGDGEILQWIEANRAHARSEWEIAAWSEFMAARVPRDAETRDFFNDYHKRVGPAREDLATWFDLLELDDYVSFGGKA